MNSTQLRNILEELKKYNRHDKAVIFKGAVEERLSKSLESYYKQLTDAFTKLDNYGDKHTLSLAAKLQKEVK